MSRVAAVLLMLGLAACGLDEAQPETPSDMQGWRGISGKPPTRAEYAAMVAACQDGAVRRTGGKTLDACLGELGLRRTP